MVLRRLMQAVETLGYGLIAWVVVAVVTVQAGPLVAIGLVMLALVVLGLLAFWSSQR